MTSTHTTRRRPSLMVEKRSQWRPVITMAGQRVRDTAPLVSIDIYAQNPLVDEVRLAAPRQHAEALRVHGDAPTLFNAGHLPLYLASGVDVGLLEQLPWIARPAASRASGAELAALLDEFAQPSEGTWSAAEARFCDDDSVLRYDQRVRDWAITDHDERIRAHLPAGSRAVFSTNSGGTSR